MEMSLQHRHQVVGVPPESGSKAFDDDGHVKRTGNFWTAASHIITAVIGSGVLSLAWAIAQLGWIAGPIMMLLFAFVINYTSCLLAECYRTGDPDTGKRNHTYMEAVRSNLGGIKVKICGFIQYLNLFGVAIGYTIAASISAVAIQRSNCFHEKGDTNPCKVTSYPYMLAFGLCEIILSQLPDFHEIWWLSIVAAIMSFLYSFIGLGLGIGKTIGNGKVKGSVTGVAVGKVTEAQKIWRSLQALGDIAFSYSFSVILIEIQSRIFLSREQLVQQATFSESASVLLFGCLGDYLWRSRASCTRSVAAYVFQFLYYILSCKLFCNSACWPAFMKVV